MISGLRGENYEDKCNELKLDTLQLRRDKQDLQEMYNIMTGTGKLNPENLFKKPKTRTGAVTRSADDPHHLPTPRKRLEIRKNFFTVRIVEKWNALPIEIKSLGKIQHFKKGTKRLSRIMVEGCTRPVCGSDQDDQPPRAATDVSTMLPGAAKEPTTQVLFK